jgi:Carboxypeptidase regulatory-like domain
LFIRAKQLLGLGCLVGLATLSLQAAPNSSKITGIVVDPAGTPQMGATVIITSERVGILDPIQVLTNGVGRFSTAAIPAGLYSIKVTLAGFLPASEQHILVDPEHATLLQVVLGSVFSSLSDLRRSSSSTTPAPGLEDWSWVLRSSPSTRPVLRWQDDTGQSAKAISEQNQDAPRGSVQMSSGGYRPGAVSDLSQSPSTAVAYDTDLGLQGHFLVAGEFNYLGDTSGGGALAGEWLSSGPVAPGSVTTFMVRESRLGSAGPTFRGLRMSHDGQMALTDRVSVRYGGEYLVAGVNGTTTSLRPRAEVAVQLDPVWQVDVLAAARPWQDSPTSDGEIQSALDTLDALPALLIRAGRPVFEDNMHEEASVRRSLGQKADLTAAVFHDRSAQTAVIGRHGPMSPDYLQDYFSSAFAYDGGASESTGARAVYRQQVNDHLGFDVIYAYGGALTPNGDDGKFLRQELFTRDRHSVAGQITTTLPLTHTKVISGYKWLNGAAVSRQDPYGEALYHIDPYLSTEFRQPLPNCIPGHVEIEAAVGNLLAQGYVRVSTANGSVLLVPSYRYFRGGLSLQF